jgi:hypothetical protein
MRASCFTKKEYLRLALYVILAVVILGYFRNTLRKGMTDFKVVHRAATRVLNQENLYNLDDGHYLYKYSPSFAVLIAPVGILPLFPAQVVWLMGMCVCLFLIIRWSKMMIMGDRSPPVYLYLLTLLLTSRFWVREFWLGQTDFLMLLLVFWFILSLNRGNQMKAAVFLALSAVIKPTSLVFVPYLLYKKKFRLLGYLVVAGVVLFFIPALVYGVSGGFGLFTGWKSIMSASSPSLITAYVNQSLFGLFHRFLAGPSQVSVLNLGYFTANVITCAVAAALFLCLLFLHKKSRVVLDGLVSQRETIEYSLLLIFMALFSPLGWFQNFFSSILACMLLLYYLSKAGFRDRFILASLILCFFLVNFFNFETVGRRLSDLFLALSSVTFGMLLVTVSLAKLRLSRIA